MKTVLIEYTLITDADVGAVEAEIRGFIAGIAALDVGIRYASHRRRGVERAYVHVGEFPSDAALATMQAAPFFTAFSAFLPTVCSQPPRVTFLDAVAATP